MLNVAFLPNVFAKLYEPGSILYILWSIGVEEQFYLIIAPLLGFIALRKYFLSLVTFTLVYFILFYSHYFSILSDYWLYYYYMSAGGVIAIIIRSGYN